MVCLFPVKGISLSPTCITLFPIAYFTVTASVLFCQVLVARWTKGTFHALCVTQMTRFVKPPPHAEAGGGRKPQGEVCPFYHSPKRRVYRKWDTCGIIHTADGAGKRNNPI